MHATEVTTARQQSAMQDCPSWCDQEHDQTPDPRLNAVIHKASIDCIPDSRGGAIEVTIEQLAPVGSDPLEPEVVIHGMNDHTLSNGRTANALATILKTAAIRWGEITAV